MVLRLPFNHQMPVGLGQTALEIHLVIIAVMGKVVRGTGGRSQGPSRANSVQPRLTPAFYEEKRPRMPLQGHGQRK